MLNKIVVNDVLIKIVFFNDMLIKTVFNDVLWARRAKSALNIIVELAH